MKRIQKGFSVVEILIVIVVVGFIAAVGLLVYDRQKGKDSEVATNSQTSQESPRNEEDTDEVSYFESKEYGFKFSYSKEWGDNVTVEPARLESKVGSAYNITFEVPVKLVAGFKTRDWAPADSAEGDWFTGFVEYGGCVEGVEAVSVVELYKTDDACLVLKGVERGEDEDFGGKTAEIVLQKRFSSDSRYAGVAFVTQPIRVDDFSESTLRAAFTQEYIDNFLLIVKTLEEI